VRGSVESTRAGLGWPTRSRALALTALVAEKGVGLRFLTARMSMEEIEPKWKCPAHKEVDRLWKSANFSTRRRNSELIC